MYCTYEQCMPLNDSYLRENQLTLDEVSDLHLGITARPLDAVSDLRFEQYSRAEGVILSTHDTFDADVYAV